MIVVSDSLSHIVKTHGLEFLGQLLENGQNLITNEKLTHFLPGKG